VPRFVSLLLPLPIGISLAAALAFAGPLHAVPKGLAAVHDVFLAAIQGMVRAADPHSYVLVDCSTGS
jgi:hypothetical protein